MACGGSCRGSQQRARSELDFRHYYHPLNPPVGATELNLSPHWESLAGAEFSARPKQGTILQPIASWNLFVAISNALDVMASAATEVVDGLGAHIAFHVAVLEASHGANCNAKGHQRILGQPDEFIDLTFEVPGEVADLAMTPIRAKPMTFGVCVFACKPSSRSSRLKSGSRMARCEKRLASAR